jgi:hypothetical protein
MFEQYPVKGNMKKNTIAQAKKRMFFALFSVYIL